MSTQVVSANPSHLKELSILFDSYRQFYQMKSDLKAAIRFISERLKLNDSRLYIAYDGNRPQGFIQVYQTFSSVAMATAWNLNDLYVAEGERNSGVAKQLITHVLNEAKRNKVFVVKLVTGKNNEIAKSLYKSLGFNLNNNFDSYSLRP